MTKYYFISYIAVDKGLVTHGHCLMTVKDMTLTDIAKEIAKECGLSSLDSVNIICLKDLSKEEYEMLKGDE